MITNNSALKGLALGALMLTAAGSATQAQTVLKTSKTGKSLYEITYSAKGDVVYVAGTGARGQNNARIYKLDAKSLAVLDSIDVSQAPAFGLGINDKTQTLYTSNTRNNSVSAIDLKTKKVLATIQAPSGKAHTRELVADEDKNLIYVSDVGAGSKIWVIDGKTNTLKTTIENTGKTTTGIALDKAKQKLYITNMGTDQIGVIDLKSYKLVDSFPAGGQSPTNVVFDAKSNRLFTANQKSGDVSVLDAGTGKLIQNVKTGEGALGIALDPARQRVFVANRTAGTVTVLDATSFKVLADLKTGTYPNTVTINPKTGNAYVTNKGAGKRDDPSYVDPNGDTVSLIGQ